MENLTSWPFSRRVFGSAFMSQYLRVAEGFEGSAVAGFECFAGVEALEEAFSASWADLDSFFVLRLLVGSLSGFDAAVGTNSGSTSSLLWLSSSASLGIVACDLVEALVERVAGIDFETLCVFFGGGSSEASVAALFRFLGGIG